MEVYLHMFAIADVMAQHRLRRTAVAVLGALLAAVLMALTVLSVPGGAARAASTTMLGDYATPLVGPPDANGVRHIDTPATIAKLRAAHVNTYAYLIYGSPLYGTGTEAQITQAQWDDLPGFADAAADAGIAVLVYLVPPTESTQAGYKPFGWDYKAWANAIAALAVTHPNIREIVMDDFAWNTAEGGSNLAFRFTPTYVAEMMQSARQTASWLTFRPIIYYQNAVGTGAVLPAYRAVVDGIVFPYRASVGGRYNTTDASLATQYGTVMSTMSKCHGGDRCAQISFPRNTPSTAGDFGGLSQRITVTPGVRQKLTFWQTDDYNSVTTGYHYLQALIDDTVVWQTDVAPGGSGLWQRQSVDVTAALAGKSSATLTFRIWDARGASNFHTAAWIDDVVGSGFTVSDGRFESSKPAPWTPSTNTPKFSVAVVPTLDIAFMTYATKFSYEPAPTSTTYVDSVVSQALALIRAGVVDGSLVYCLNLTGLPDGRSDPATYDVVRDLYRSFPRATR